MGLWLSVWSVAAWGWEAPYAFLEGKTGERVPLEQKFATPDGYTRAPVELGSYQAWLRKLPVHPTSTQVRTHAGRPVAAPAAAVVVMDVGRADLQQCADSALRLYAEYRWTRGDADALGFHFTSGDESRWADWRQGERFKVQGARVERVRGASTADDHASYRAWLQHTFLYAGTRSLALDAQAVPVDAPVQAGDVFVSPGSPGHAVVVLDVAASASGQQVGLLGQGFMPAQTFHVLRGEGGLATAGWFTLPQGSGEVLHNPSWAPLPREGLLRFESAHDFDADG